jgi:predicted adenylyl cyclase CyaB
MIETEVKIRIQDALDMRRRLLDLGCTVSNERFFESDTFYDLSGEPLARSRGALRLRTIGKRSWLTFKGAPRKARSFKVREEHESEIRNPAEFRKILKALGFHPVFKYGKRRTHLRIGRLRICLDETSIGNFIELEGKRAEIVRFAKQLGYRRTDFITLDYVRMVREAADAAKAR